MSLKTKLFSAITASFAVAAFATFASAQETPAATEKADAQKLEKMERKGPRGHGEFGREMRGDKHRGGMPGLRGIELTDAQKDQLRAIHEANRPDENTRQEMMTLMKAKRDGTLTAEQQEKFKAFRDQAREKGEKIHQQVLAILTPEQRQQIETRKQEMRKRMEGRRELQKQQRAQPTEKAKPTDN